MIFFIIDDEPELPLRITHRGTVLLANERGWLESDEFVWLSDWQ